LGFLPGQKRAYQYGETVTLVVRVRNVGKETVKFSYLQPFIEHSPTVTDRDGKPVPQPNVFKDIGARLPGLVELPPGKEIELHELKRELRPASESGSKKFMQPYALYGTGKVSIQYEHVFGMPSMGVPGWKLDPTLSKLATGKLELEINPEPPPLPPPSGSVDGGLQPTTPPPADSALPPLVGGKSEDRQIPPDSASGIVSKRLGMKLAPVDLDAVARVGNQLRGGMEVISINAKGIAARAGIKKGDILVGLHKWETVSMENVKFVLDHPDLATFNPVSFVIVRSGHMRKGKLRVPETDDK
jgi:hypothetical protein